MAKDIFIGAAPVTDIKVGGTDVQKVYVGADVVWERTSIVVEQVPPLTQADEDSWQVSGVLSSFGRVNGNNDFRAESTSTPGSGARVSLDLWDYVNDGDVCTISLELTGVRAGQLVDIGLDDSATSATVDFGFPGSPYSPSELGIKTLSAQTINSSKRYLKVLCTLQEWCEWTNIIVSID